MRTLPSQAKLSPHSLAYPSADKLILAHRSAAQMSSAQLK